MEDDELVKNFRKSKGSTQDHGRRQCLGLGATRAEIKGELDKRQVVTKFAIREGNDAGTHMSVCDRGTSTETCSNLERGQNDSWSGRRPERR